MAATSSARPAPPTSLPPTSTAARLDTPPLALIVMRTADGDVRATAAPTSWALLVEPDLGQILLQVVARRQVPALDRRRGGDDAVPPQEGHSIRLRQSMALELAHHCGALARIRRYRLADIEPVKEAIGRAGMVAGR